MEKALVSVVLCTYNGERFLAEQIDSILAQSYRPIELIISDDASTDGTRALLAHYVSHPLVRVYYQEKNTGLTRNFASAAAHTKGEYIAFSDQDDIWMPDKIEKLVAAMGTSPLVYSNSLLVDEQGNSMGKKLSGIKKMYSGSDSRGYILYSCVWGHGMLITRELFEKSLPMPEDIHHDIWITFKAFQHGGIKYVDEVLTHYRQHTASTSQTLPKRDTPSTKQRRHTAFKKKLRWIRLMEEHERPEYQPFYSELARLYAQKEHRKYVLALSLFMLKYRKKIFMLSTKGIADHLVEITKYGIGTPG